MTTTVLRPMSTGEILDRTFNMYRGNFWLFVGIAALPPAMMLVANLLMTTITAVNTTTGGRVDTAASVVTMVTAGIGAIVALIAYMIGLAVAQGASVYAVSAVHLGRSTSIRESYQRMKGKYGRLVWVFILVGLRFVGVALIFIVPAILIPNVVRRGGPGVAAVIGIVFLLAMIPAMVLILVLVARYSLVVPACVLEDKKGGEALKRSAVLAKGSRRKILAIYVLVGVLNAGISFVLLLPLQYLTITVKAGFMHVVTLALHNLAQFVVGALVGPLAIIAFALVYYDERVRKEAYDIQLLMESVAGPAPAEPASSLVSQAGAGISAEKSYIVFSNPEDRTGNHD